jgi:hypothetical protein
MSSLPDICPMKPTPKQWQLDDVVGARPGLDSERGPAPRLRRGRQPEHGTGVTVARKMTEQEGILGEIWCAGGVARDGCALRAQRDKIRLYASEWGERVRMRGGRGGSGLVMPPA